MSPFWRNLVVVDINWSADISSENFTRFTRNFRLLYHLIIRIQQENTIELDYNMVIPCHYLNILLKNKFIFYFVVSSCEKAEEIISFPRQLSWEAGNKLSVF